MGSLCPSTVRTRGSIFAGSWRSLSCPTHKGFGKRWPRRFLFPVSMTASSRPENMGTTLACSPLPASASGDHVGFFKETGSTTSPLVHHLEERIEKGIYAFRFFALLGVSGSLVGSVLCFLKGCTYVGNAFMEFFLSSGKVISLLIEAIDVYLIGTVMLVFGMGLYELFISNLDIAKTSLNRSNFFGLFMIQERPKWLDIQSISELKTKLGHVIVMLLLVGLFEKCKKLEMFTSKDLLCFATSILLSSCGLYLLSKLQDLKGSRHS